MMHQTQRDRNVPKKKNMVMSLSLRMTIRRFIKAALALVMACSLFLLTMGQVQANTVTINDQTGVLDAGRIQTAAATFPVPLLIFTIKTFSWDLDAFNQYTRKQLPNQDTLVIGITTETVPRDVSIQSGTRVHLSDSQASEAVSTFQNTIKAVSTFQNTHNGNDYTSATIAAMNSVQGALSGSAMTPFEVAGIFLLGIGGVIVATIAIIRRPKRDGGRYRVGGGTPFGLPHSSGTGGGGSGGGAGGGGSGGGAGGSF